jgi:hypothetical protein
MQYNRSVTVIYHAGSGGEFFCWLMGQHAGFNAMGINLDADKNKWTLHSQTIPKHQHLDSVNQFDDYEFHSSRINIMRDHLAVNGTDIEQFLEQRYDRWSESLLVYLGPMSDQGKKLTMDLHHKKLNSRVSANSFDNLFQKLQQAVGDRKILWVDNSVLISDPPQQLVQVYKKIAQHFSIDSAIFPETVISFLELWRNKNNIIP